MTTHTWECLLDGAHGEAASHEDAIAAAQQHNLAAEHDAPAISYGHDAPPPDPALGQWQEIERVRGLQLLQTDWLASAPSDVPDSIAAEAHQYEQEWLAFRQALRDVMNDSDPTTLQWPTLPLAPKITISTPPYFVQWDWPDYVPA